MTSTNHGAQIGGASDPCETLYKLVMAVREYEKKNGEEDEVRSDKEWKKVYMKIVKRKDQVMRKGKEETKKPNIVNWPR